MPHPFQVEYENWKNHESSYDSNSEFEFSNEWHDRLDYVTELIADAQGREYDDYIFYFSGDIINIVFHGQKIIEFHVSVMWSDHKLNTYLKD